MKKYEQINIITLFAMFMIATIHYFNFFVDDFIIIGSNIIVPLLRGFAIIAVPLFVVNIGFSNLLSTKRINFEKLILYIIIPTVIFTYISHVLYGSVEVYFTMKEGFSGSWFGDMYIGLIIFIPLITYYYHKYKFPTFIIGILISCFGYLLSILWGSSTLSDLGMLVFIPYTGMLIVLTYLVFDMKKPPRSFLFIVMIICIFIEGLAYAEIFEFSRIIITSYFSPITLLLTYCFFSLIYSSNIQIKNIRYFTQTSYFYYFTSYVVLNYFRYYQIDFVAEYSLVSYILTIVCSGILSYLTFIFYRLVLRILKLEQ